MNLSLFFGLGIIIIILILSNIYLLYKFSYFKKDIITWHDYWNKMFQQHFSITDNTIQELRKHNKSLQDIIEESPKKTEA